MCDETLRQEVCVRGGSKLGIIRKRSVVEMRPASKIDLAYNLLIQEQKNLFLNRVWLAVVIFFFIPLQGSEER